jgi:hypothetical protein
MKIRFGVCWDGWNMRGRKHAEEDEVVQRKTSAHLHK